MTVSTQLPYPTINPGDARLYKKKDEEFSSQDYINYIIKNQPNLKRDIREQYAFRAVQLDGNNMRAYSTLTFAMTERPNHENIDVLEVGVQYCHAVEVNHKDTEDQVGLGHVLANYGWIEYRLALLTTGATSQDHKERAIEVLKRAKQVYPEEKRIYLTLARIAWHIGNNKAEATQYLDETEKYSDKHFIKTKIEYERLLLRRGIRYPPREEPREAKQVHPSNLHAQGSRATSITIKHVKNKRK